MSESENFFDLLANKLMIRDEDLESGTKINSHLKSEPEFEKCFRKAAKEILEPDIYLEVEKRAMRILDEKGSSS